MGKRDETYNISLIFTCLYLLTLAILGSGTAVLLEIITPLEELDRARFLAVLAVEGFLLAAILAVSVSLTLRARKQAEATLPASRTARPVAPVGVAAMFRG